ncbi:uncharacterized protein LOC126399093 isoform X1 [Epinephelus moara]|uniref:uncharacterized protein LOC126399093 isoform X1 n=1 Tax=Epinephelus moara TaxID=300413 RepID=UPI00214F2CBC|nr:uncharacterized protein LOC126399093 isoform X1 [Epinephelus moara]
MPIPAKFTREEALEQIFNTDHFVDEEDYDETGSEIEGDDEDEDNGDDDFSQYDSEDEWTPNVRDGGRSFSQVALSGRTEQRSIQYKRRGRGPSATSHGSKTRFLFSAARDEEELSESRAQPRSSPTRSRSPLPAGERGRTAQRGRHQPQRRGRGRTTASRGRGVAAHHRTSPAPHPEWCDTNWQPKNIPFNANPGPASKAAAL